MESNAIYLDDCETGFAKLSLFKYCMSLMQKRTELVQSGPGSDLQVGEEGKGHDARRNGT